MIFDGSLGSGIRIPGFAIASLSANSLAMVMVYGSFSTALRRVEYSLICEDKNHVAASAVMMIEHTKAKSGRQLLNVVVI